MPDALTIVVSVLTGGTAGAGVSTWQAARLRGTALKGRARLVHEDLYRLQSTVTRLYYETPAERAWGNREWLLTALATKEDQQDVAAHLKQGTEFTAAAGALGWAEYLREGYGQGDAPDDHRLVRIYRRLESGRQALLSRAKLQYRPHHPQNVVAPTERVRNQATELSVEESDSMRSS